MKKTKLVASIILLGVSVISCYSSKDLSPASGWGYYNSGNGGFQTSEMNGIVVKNEVGNRSMKTERKVLFSAYLSLTVSQPDTANVYIQKITQKYDGYVSQIGTERTIVRVKSMFLDSAIANISALGRVEYKNITGEDVTEDYLDFKIRLENAEKARKRYLELLEKAENVEAALKVEKELERLNGSIDLLKGKMNRINHLSEFSTITIQLKEKKKPGIVGYVGIGIYRSVKWLFVRN